MRALAWAAALALMLSLTACYPLFLQPLFTDRDLVSGVDLAGVWQKPGDDEKWIVSAAGKEFKATHVVGGESEHLMLRVGTLGDVRFLEMRGEKNPDDSQAIPGHSLWRIRLEGDSLEVIPLNPEYFEGLIQSGKLEMAQVVRKEFVVFTGTTQQVRAFLTPRLGEAGMYQTAERYRRTSRDGSR
jgi:hypothetical protein